MKLKQLWLINFRNYEQTVIPFEGMTVIVGQNGSGKTNILEALDILATSKSKIVKGINKCIKHGQQGFIITGLFEKQGKELEIVFKQEKRLQKSIRVDQDIIQRTSELLGLVNSVIFLPQDIEIIQGSPQQRRKYLDIFISQIERSYYENLSQYQRVLKQRNEVLKQIRDRRTQGTALDIWDTQLAQLNAAIIVKRLEYVDKIQHMVQDLFTQMNFSYTLKVTYDTDLTQDKEKNYEVLVSQRSQDILYNHTSMGIHSDDMVFTCDGHKVTEYCSQGQQRLMSLSIKCAEAQIKQQVLNDPPIILIDDVLLELDVERFNMMIKTIAPESQKIFTVTDTRRFDQETMQKMFAVNVHKGTITL